MAGHTFLFREGIWRAEGEFLDGTGSRSEVEGRAQVRHYPDRWVLESEMRTRAAKPIEQRSVYEIVPFPPGNIATAWTSQNAALGTLRGRFLVVGDTILSVYESATGRYRGYESVLQREERRCAARGALFDGAKLLSAWAVELMLSA